MMDIFKPDYVKLVKFSKILKIAKKCSVKISKAGHFILSYYPIKCYNMIDLNNEEKKKS